MSERGVIQNVKRAQQILDFSGLIYGKITPTDIDGLIEYKDTAYVVFELKYNGAELPFGQRLAYERIVKDFSKANKKAIVIVANHTVEDTGKSVPAAECLVREAYHTDRQEWWQARNDITLRELVDAYFKYIEQFHT